MFLKQHLIITMAPSALIEILSYVIIEILSYAIIEILSRKLELSFSVEDIS